LSGKNDYVDTREAVCYDEDYKTFFNLADVETELGYRYWDGSNWKIITFGGPYDDTGYSIVAIDPETRVDLDTWDGNNWNTGKKRFYHESLYKITSIDGQLLNDQYLVYEYSQWQGDLPTGTILDQEEAEQHKEKMLSVWD